MMMNSTTLSQIEESINQLPLDEQVRLIQRITQRIKKKNLLDRQLASMAADLEIQRELRAIDQEFAITESDGLEAR